MTPVEKVKIATMFEREGLGVTEIARRVNRDVKTVRTVTSELERGSRSGELVQKVEERLAQDAVDEASETMKRIKDAKNDAYGIATFIHKLIGKTLNDAKKDNKPLSSVTNDIKVLKEAAMAAKIAREERYAVLCIKEDDDDDDELPNFTVAELTADEIHAMKHQQREESGLDDPDTVVVGELEVDLNGND
ncbi:hypothetical protein [Cupriavidus metallidurans]|uniref:hypothetical protein n=1 Tax=Cupriavidus metallidurans TaxID=119219 RepID=UPI001CCE5A5E|nr:hypothetical protein [Cupriavidus metallidurans]UBM12769.1 hypothetical protein LAI70_27845 [Cupriavidus metallidurans]